MLVRSCFLINLIKCLRGRNSETKSRTIDPKVPKRNQRRGLRAPLCQKTGPIRKKLILGRKPDFWGQKKTYTFRSQPCSSHDRAKLSKEKSTLFPNEYQSFSKFRNFFWKKTDFRPVFRFSAKRKNGRFSVNPAGTGSVVIVGHFFGEPVGPNKFR